MSKVEVNTNGSSTYNSDGIYVSDNTFEELEEIFSSEFNENIIIDAEAPEIIGIFDFPTQSDAVETWYGSKKTQLAEAFDLKSKINALTFASRKQYQDHFDETQNEFESSFTEIDNIKGRYFLLEDPNLLQSVSADALNPYLDYFTTEDSPTGWEGYSYSKYSYWAFLNAQNDYISAIGNSRKPPSIEGSHENMVDNLRNAALDRKWKIGMVNGSELAQACIQSIYEIVRSAVSLNDYSPVVHIGSNQFQSIFEYMQTSSILSIGYASQYPGIIIQRYPDPQYSSTIQEGAASSSGGSNTGQNGGTIIGINGVSASYMQQNPNVSAFDVITSGGSSSAGGPNGTNMSIQSGGDNLLGVDVLEPIGEDAPAPEDMYSDFNFLDYQILAKILKKYGYKILSGTTNLKDVILGNAPDSVSIATIKSDLVAIISDGGLFEIMAAAQSISHWIEEESSIASGFNLNQNRYMYREEGEDKNFGKLKLGIPSKFKALNESATMEIASEELPNTANNLELLSGANVTSTDNGPLLSFNNSQPTNINVNTSTFNAELWLWNALASIMRAVVNGAIEKTHRSLLQNFGSTIGSYEDFRSYILNDLQGESSTILNIFKNVFDQIPASQSYELEITLAGKFNLYNINLLNSHDGTGGERFIATPAGPEIESLVLNWKNFLKMRSRHTALTLSEYQQERITESIIPPQILSTYPKKNETPTYLSIDPFEEIYEDSMSIQKGSVSIPTNPFWNIPLPNITANGENQKDNIISAWEEIDKIENEITKSQNRILKFTSTTLSSELSGLVKKGSIDLGFIFRNYFTWNKQVQYLKELLLSTSYEKPSEKWQRILKFFEDAGTNTYEKLNLQKKSIIVIGIPFSKWEPNTYELKVDSNIIQDADIKEVDDDDYEKCSYALFTIHGVDTSIENFPSDSIWNLQYYNDLLIENNHGIFDWSKEDFLENRQITAVDSKWNIFPFLFPEMTYSQIMVEKKYKSITYILVDSEKLEGNIQIEFSN